MARAGGRRVRRPLAFVKYVLAISLPAAAAAALPCEQHVLAAINREHTLGTDIATHGASGGGDSSEPLFSNHLAHPCAGLEP